ncbi:MAG TPA: GNAT family N-acetyltransferase [Pyrinomonadaceae bacterium]|nr:GNAT family N-acetyltransferase [Pyrinomonadaceae bacterium]
MSRVGVSYTREHEGFVISPMTEHDLLEVVEIEETCGLSLWGWDAYRTELERPESLMLVAQRPAQDFQSAKRVSAFIAARVNAGELHINNIGVRAEARRRGLGKALLGLALDFGRQAGAEFSILEVRAGNSAAQYLYASLGYALAGRRHNYYRQPAEDALVMTMRLGARA